MNNCHYLEIFTFKVNIFKKVLLYGLEFKRKIYIKLWFFTENGYFSNKIHFQKWKISDISDIIFRWWRQVRSCWNFRQISWEKFFKKSHQKLKYHSRCHSWPWQWQHIPDFTKPCGKYFKGTLTAPMPFPIMKNFSRNKVNVVLLVNTLTWRH